MLKQNDFVWINSNRNSFDVKQNIIEKILTIKL